MQTPQIELVEVALRDGLQSEPEVMPTETKLEFLRHLVGAGIRTVELTSFVHPKRVPQMADAEQLVREAGETEPNVHVIGLVLNLKGCERALAAGVDEVGFVVVATDTFNLKNQGVTTCESAATWAEVQRRCRDAGVRSNVMVSAAFGCPYEGEVSPARVLGLVEKLMETPPDVIAVADTIGVAVPPQVEELVQGMRPMVGEIPIRCHFHNTRNTGIANSLAAIDAGARLLDASTGGLGGCPFAPAATGNVPAEDLVYALERSGFDTGISLDRLVECSRWLAGVLDRELPGLVARAGPFPQRAA